MQIDNEIIPFPLLSLILLDPEASGGGNICIKEKIEILNRIQDDYFWCFVPF